MIKKSCQHFNVFLPFWLCWTLPKAENDNCRIFLHLYSCWDLVQELKDTLLYKFTKYYAVQTYLHAWFSAIVTVFAGMTQVAGFTRTSYFYFCLLKRILWSYYLNLFLLQINAHHSIWSEQKLFQKLFNKKLNIAYNCLSD